MINYKMKPTKISTCTGVTKKNSTKAKVFCMHCKKLGGKHFHCQVCNIHCHGSVPYQAHLSGVKHKRIQRIAIHYKDHHPEDTETSKAVWSGGYLWCAQCHSSDSSPSDLDNIGLGSVDIMNHMINKHPVKKSYDKKDFVLKCKLCHQDI